jgi:hypothetical protein
MTHDSEQTADDQFVDRIEDLGAIEDQPASDVAEGSQTRNSRYLYWLIGALCALTIGIAEVGILARSSTADVPVSPSAMQAAFERDPCAGRMRAIMAAIAAYTNTHGSPPSTLAALHPDYLAFEPIDAVSNQPYGYRVVGESVSVSCPGAGLAASTASLGNGIGGRRSSVP